jgi:Protein of unknown function (DUF2934)
LKKRIRRLSKTQTIPPSIPLYTDYMDPVINIELAKAPIEPLLGFDKDTSLLSSAHRFRTHTVLGFCAPDIQKGPDVAGIFNSVQSLDGKWVLEIAVELSDLLPAIDGKSEAVLTAVDRSGIKRQLCLSNRMSRFHYEDRQIPYHALLPRTQTWHGSVQVRGESGVMLVAAEEQLRTMVSMRFQVEGDTTEHAFESSIKRCLQSFFDCINTTLDATRHSGNSFTPITRSVTSDSMSSAYVLMSGSGNPQGAKLVLSGLRVFLYPVEIRDDQAARLRAIVDGSVILSDVDRLIGYAKSSWQDGDYEFAFLQAVIAAEIATTRAIRAECVRRGVSKNKLDDNRKEMTYSWALNLGLPLCFEPQRRPSDALVSAMNAARSKRNDLMHEATFNMARNELRQLIDDTREYVIALRGAKSPDDMGTSPGACGAPVGSEFTDDQRRERAYFSWLNRGKPNGDDWADWFEAIHPA